jgi:hypothetical protein
MGSCYCQHDCFCMSDSGSDICETMTLDSLAALPEPCGEAEMSWSETESLDCNFNYEDLMSNIENMSEDWYLTFDWECHFPTEHTDSEGTVWRCDSEEWCWTYLADTDESCDD